MQLLDREYQRNLLFQLAQHYPEPCVGLIQESGGFHTVESVNLHYLAELGLVRIEGVIDLLGRKHFKEGPELIYITARGWDFISDDGGLTAILGVVTVKLHSETLSALEGKILASEELPPEEKTRLLDRLRSLPEEGAKTLVQEMVKAGLSRGTEVWETALRYLSG